MSQVNSTDAPAVSKAFIAMSGCSIALLGLVATGLGTCVLYLYRADADDDMVGPDSKAQPASEMDAIRLELLSLSGDLSDPGQKDHDLTRASNKLQALEVRLDAQREDPSYLKVRALHESVQLQLDVLADGEIPVKVPPLPHSSIAPDPDESMVGQPLDKRKLVKNKIFNPSGGLDLRYGPGRFYIDGGVQEKDSLGGLSATTGWKFCVVDVGLRGNMDLVEFTIRLLDDYHRAFPAHLVAEKELEDEQGKKTPWRNMHSVSSRKRVVWLSRVFMMPENAITSPILEIHRQGVSRKVWIQL